MSNPYEPNSSGEPSGESGGSSPYGQSPYGQSPYGQSPYGSPTPPASPYGSPPGGADPYGGGSPYGEAPKKTDALSIVAFVLSLTCCLSVVGAILGFVGLGRTKQGRRKGRWAAVSAMIIGILGTLAFAGIIVAITVAVKHSISVENAAVGECMNVSDSSSNSVTLSKRSCTDSHDAEIVYVGVKGSIQPDLVPKSIDDLSDANIAKAVCSSLVGTTNASKLGGYEYSIVSKDPDDTSADSKFLCYVENQDGSKLDSKIL